MHLEQRQRKVRRLTRELDAARDDLRSAMIAARDSGETISEIARRLDVTRARVYQIIGR